MYATASVAPGLIAQSWINSLEQMGGDLAWDWAGVKCIYGRSYRVPIGFRDLLLAMRDSCVGRCGLLVDVPRGRTFRASSTIRLRLRRLSWLNGRRAQSRGGSLMPPLRAEVSSAGPQLIGRFAIVGVRRRENEAIYSHLRRRVGLQLGMLAYFGLARSKTLPISPVIAPST